MSEPPVSRQELYDVLWSMRKFVIASVQLSLAASRGDAEKAQAQADEFGKLDQELRNTMGRLLRGEIGEQ